MPGDILEVKGGRLVKSRWEKACEQLKSKGIDQEYEVYKDSLTKILNWIKR